MGRFPGIESRRQAYQRLYGLTELGLGFVPGARRLRGARPRSTARAVRACTRGQRIPVSTSHHVAALRHLAI